MERVGSLGRLPSGRWRVRVSAGSVNGRRRVLVRTAATHDAAVAVLAELLADREMMPRRHRAARLAFGPLAELVARRSGPDRVFSTVAEVAGVCRGTVHRWAVDGVPVDAADRVAVRLGEHPGSVWPAWWQVADPG